MKTFEELLIVTANPEKHDCSTETTDLGIALSLGNIPLYEIEEAADQFYNQALEAVYTQFHNERRCTSEGLKEIINQLKK